MSSPETWRTLPLDWRPSATVLAETLAGGQAFRWHCRDGIWTGQWAQHVIQLRLDADGALQWRDAVNASADAAPLLAYLAGGVDFAALRDSLPWRSDAALAAALDDWPGLRLLRQPFGETLLAFLCSSTKRIAQIAIMMETMAARLGETLPGGYQALPGWPALHEAGEAALRACGLGYRARFVAGTADFLQKHPGWLEEVEALPYPVAKARLLELPGVGEKIADCVLLFGAGRFEAFPVDTWIIKVMQRLYGLNGWKPEQIAAFGRAHFGPFAGYAQQVLFAGSRRGLEKL